MMKRIDPLLIQEVRELTSFIRSGEWPEVRDLIAAAGYDPDTHHLVAFMEGEEGEEWGVLATPDAHFHEWYRNTDRPFEKPTWRAIEMNASAIADYPQIEAALALIRGMHGL